MNGLGCARKFLGMESSRAKNQRKMFLKQSGYLKKILSKFGLDGVKTVITHMANHFRLIQIKRLNIWLVCLMLQL